MADVAKGAWSPPSDEDGAPEIVLRAVKRAGSVSHGQKSQALLLGEWWFDVRHRVLPSYFFATTGSSGCADSKSASTASWAAGSAVLPKRSSR